MMPGCRTGAVYVLCPGASFSNQSGGGGNAIGNRTENFGAVNLCCSGKRYLPYIYFVVLWCSLLVTTWKIIYWDLPFLSSKSLGYGTRGEAKHAGAYACYIAMLVGSVFGCRKTIRQNDLAAIMMGVQDSMSRLDETGTLILILHVSNHFQWIEIYKYISRKRE